MIAVAPEPFQFVAVPSERVIAYDFVRDPNVM
jgi:hypothetical protein